MEVKIKMTRTFNAKYVIADFGVRYFEDGLVNGEDDISYEEQENGAKPRMPLVYKKDKDWRWKIKIDIDEGRIIDWPTNVTAIASYKVCDDGHYILLDDNEEVIYESESYVPYCFYCASGSGYGDYTYLEIDENGYIKDWKPYQIDSVLKEQNFLSNDDEE